MAGSIRKKGKKWELCVSCSADVFGKRTRKYKYVDGTISKREAEKVLAEFVTECNKMQTNSNMKFSDYIKFWFREHAEKHYRTNTTERYRMLVGRIEITLGHKKLTEITPQHIIKFLDMISQNGMKKAKNGKTKGKLSKQTIVHYYTFLSVLFQTAYRWQLVNENVCRRVKRPSPGKKEKKLLSLDQLKFVLSMLKNEHIKYQIAINILVYTAMRKGEVFALTWNDVDLNNGEITVTKTIYPVYKKGMEVGDAKTTTSNRIVTIPDHVISMLISWKEKCPGKEVIFCNKKGEYLSHTSLYYFWQKFLRKLKIDHVTIHSLRHLTASLLVAEGLDLVTVANMLGHATPDMLVNVYAHKVRKANASEIMKKIINAEIHAE